MANAKMKPDELMFIYNNMARARGVAVMPMGTKMTLHEVADKIEWVNKLPFPQRNKKNGKMMKPKLLKSQIEKERRARTAKWVKNFLFPPKKQIGKK